MREGYWTECCNEDNDPCARCTALLSTQRGCLLRVPVTVATVYRDDLEVQVQI